MEVNEGNLLIVSNSTRLLDEDRNDLDEEAVIRDANINEGRKEVVQKGNSNVCTLHNGIHK